MRACWWGGEKKLRSVRQSGDGAPRTLIIIVIIIILMWREAVRRPIAGGVPGVLAASRWQHRFRRPPASRPTERVSRAPATHAAPTVTATHPVDRTHALPRASPLIISPLTPSTTFVCARAPLRPRFPCVITATRLPTSRLTVVVLAVAAATTASVPVRSECSVLLVARRRHTRVTRQFRCRSVINSFRVLAVLTCVQITPTVSCCAIHIDPLYLTNQGRSRNRK